MNRTFSIRLLLTLLATLASPSLWAESRVEGRVVNGTTNRPVVKHPVRLLQPAGGMRLVATTWTDSQGNFLFDQRELDPDAFYLLETEFQGVKYPAPARFDSTGTATVSLMVYDSTPSDATLRIETLRVLVRAEGAKAQVREQYAVLNSSHPPCTVSNSDGTFRFHLSAKGAEPAVVVTGLMNMPLPQTVEGGSNPGDFSIRYALKPGMTTVNVEYDADYTSHELALGDRVPYNVDHTEVYVSPLSLSVKSPLLRPAGLDSTHDIQKLEARDLPRGAPLELRVTGEATPSTRSENARREPEVKVVPNSMTQLAGLFLACLLLVLFWALGVRVAKEWHQWQQHSSRSPVHKQLEAKVDGLFNSIADLDELFASGKLGESKYWKERLDLKAKLAAALKKAPHSLLESYATRHTGP